MQAPKQGGLDRYFSVAMSKDHMSAAKTFFGWLMASAPLIPFPSFPHVGLVKCPMVRLLGLRPLCFLGAGALSKDPEKA